MPYIKETCIAGNTIEVSKHYSYKWHKPGEIRSKKAIPSKECQKRINQRKAARDLRRLMNCNFFKGDYLVTLDFQKEKEISPDEIQTLIQKFIRRLRIETKRQGLTLKYIYTKEIGPRGSKHLHILLNRIPSEMLVKTWPHGGINIKPIYTDENSAIADYFVKYALKTEETEKAGGYKVGKRWYSSKNLLKPRIRRKVISAKEFRKEPSIKKGFEVLKDLTRRGFSEVTGFEFLSYVLLKTERPDKKGGGGYGNSHIYGRED